jgi:hypothetical protein
MTDSPDGRFAPLSADLRDRLSLALVATMALREQGLNPQLLDVVTHACAESRAHDLRAEQMVIALKALYASLPPVTFGSEGQRRVVFDRFLSGCIVRWFEDAG